MNKKNLTGYLILGILLVGMPLGFYFYFHSNVPNPPAPPKQFGKAPYFMLTTQDSSTVSSDDLKGFIYVADFFFTHCNTVCPMLSDTLKKLQQSYKSEERFKLVSFTIDPERDDVPTLKKYAERYGAFSEKWMFLTGEAKYIRDSIGVRGFKVPVAPESDADGQFTHTDRMVLVDGDGEIRGYFNIFEKGQMDSLVNSIERVLIEKKRK